jgi:hypothetical protein
MLQLVRDVKKSVNSDLLMEWLKPLMTGRKCAAGGARASAMPDPRQAALKRTIAGIRAQAPGACANTAGGSIRSSP